MTPRPDDMPEMLPSAEERHKTAVAQAWAELNSWGGPPVGVEQTIAEFTTKAIEQAFRDGVLAERSRIDTIAREQEAELARLVALYYRREIGRLMHQAEHWAKNGKPLAAHHRVNAADCYYQIVVLMERDLGKGWQSPFDAMREALARPCSEHEGGAYPPSPEISAYHDARHTVAQLYADERSHTPEPGSHDFTNEEFGGEFCDVCGRSCIGHESKSPDRTPEPSASTLDQAREIADSNENVCASCGNAFPPLEPCGAAINAAYSKEPHPCYPQSSEPLAGRIAAAITSAKTAAREAAAQEMLRRFGETPMGNALAAAIRTLDDQPSSSPVDDGWRSDMEAAKTLDEDVILGRTSDIFRIVAGWDDHPDQKGFSWVAPEGQRYQDAAFNRWMPLPPAPETSNV